MKNLKNIQVFYFVGIGGIGMSALARYFKLTGKHVMGYDKTPSAITAALIEEGIQIGFIDEISDLRAHNETIKEHLLYHKRKLHAKGFDTNHMKVFNLLKYR